jgi:hypothetical protein
MTITRKLLATGSTAAAVLAVAGWPTAILLTASTLLVLSAVCWVLSSDKRAARLGYLLHAWHARQRPLPRSALDDGRCFDLAAGGTVRRTCQGEPELRPSEHAGAKHRPVKPKSEAAARKQKGP